MTTSKSVTIVNTGTNDQTVLDVKVLLSLNYPDDQDLVLKLTGPNGTTITLTGSATGANFLDTTFDAQATKTIAGGSAPYTGHFKPTGSLATFNGINPNGTWTLEIDDNHNRPVGGKLLSWGLQITTRTNDNKLAQTGNLMDQNADGVGGQNPGVNGIGSIIDAAAPGDVYADPIPAPATTQIYDGSFIPGPYLPTSLPLIISGPVVSRTFINGTSPTLDNLITDNVISSAPGGASLHVVFDRDMDPTTILNTINFNLATFPNPTITPETTHVLRLSTPYGTFTNGQLLPDGSQLVLTLSADPNRDSNNPNSDPDPTHPRTYKVNIQKLLPGTNTPVDFPQEISGSYSVTLTSDIQSTNGEALDTNQNAGLDFLRGTSSTTTSPFTYFSQAAVPIGTNGGAGQTYVSTINVPDSFLVQNLNLSINIVYPNDPDLIATLVALRRVLPGLVHPRRQRRVQGELHQHRPHGQRHHTHSERRPAVPGKLSAPVRPVEL